MWRYAHNDELREYFHEYAIKNSLKRSLTQKRYYNTPKGRSANLNAANTRRSNIDKKKSENITGYIQFLIQNQKLCYWCDKELNGKFHIDHIIPLSKGGGHTENNVVLSCRPCNASKHNLMPIEFLTLRQKRNKPISKKFFDEFNNLNLESIPKI
jgi:5-methylcytosine-specific restriction endonuclease McrA